MGVPRGQVVSSSQSGTGSPADVSVIGQDAHFLTATLISNPLQRFDVIIFDCIKDSAADLLVLSGVVDECH
mgnify:CR=1 FL=1